MCLVWQAAGIWLRPSDTDICAKSARSQLFIKRTSSDIVECESMSNDFAVGVCRYLSTGDVCRLEFATQLDTDSLRDRRQHAAIV